MGCGAAGCQRNSSTERKEDLRAGDTGCSSRTCGRQARRRGGAELAASFLTTSLVVVMPAAWRRAWGAWCPPPHHIHLCVQYFSDLCSNPGKLTGHVFGQGRVSSIDKQSFARANVALSNSQLAQVTMQRRHTRRGPCHLGRLEGERGLQAAAAVWAASKHHGAGHVARTSPPTALARAWGQGVACHQLGGAQAPPPATHLASTWSAIRSAASCTVEIFSAPSSSSWMSNFSSSAIMISTVSRESAPRSTNLDSASTWVGRGRGREQGRVESGMEWGQGALGGYGHSVEGGAGLQGLPSSGQPMLAATQDSHMLCGSRTACACSPNSSEARESRPPPPLSCPHRVLLNAKLLCNDGAHIIQHLVLVLQRAGTEGWLAPGQTQQHDAFGSQRYSPATARSDAAHAWHEEPSPAAVQECCQRANG